MTKKTHMVATAQTPSVAIAGATQLNSPLRLTYLIAQLDRIVYRRLSEALALNGITLPQYTALSVLRTRGRSTNAQLAERAFITPQSANEVVKTMEANGWVMRESDPIDRRVVLLQPTKAGTALLEQCDVAADRVEQGMLEDMDAGDAQTLRLLLQVCVRNLRAA
jgi:DNA-binding MarR family transcriptional regulator